PVREADRHAPACRGLVPLGTRDLRLEAAAGPQTGLVEHAREVAPQLGLLAVVLAPVVRGLEGVAVLMARHVDARAGIAVLPPGAARAGGLLHYPHAGG